MCGGVGPPQGHKKLTPKPFNLHGWPLARIAEKFSVTPMFINKVCNSGSWAAVGGFPTVVVGKGGAKLKRLHEMVVAAKAKKLEAD